MANTYRQVLSVPGVLRFFLPAGVARLGVAMTGLGLIWLVHWGTGSFGVAGVVTGFFAISEACCGPLIARLIDRRGQMSVLPTVLAVHGLAIAGLVIAVALHAQVWVLVLLGVLAGGSIPQIGALSAARWSWLLHEQSGLRAAFALEAAGNDAVFLIGPAIAALVSTAVTGFAGTLTAVTLLLTGGFLFNGAHQSAPPAHPVAAGTDRAESSERGLRRPTLWVLITVNLGLGLMFGSLQVSVTAFAVSAGDGAWSGLIYGLMSLASIVAGLGFGMRRWGIRPETQLLLAWVVIAVGCAALTQVSSTWALAGALLIPGIAIAPTMVLTGVLTKESVDGSVLTQAYTLQNSASAAGVAVGAALAGHAIDAVAADAGFTVSLESAVSLVVVVTVWRLGTARRLRSSKELMK